MLEKVTLIKDIRCQNPHRAHIEILFDLSLEEIAKTYRIASFEDLHNAWRKILDSSELNRRFFQEIANWYFWATQTVTFPKDAGKSKETRNSASVIRLITRLIFVWFLKEKRLVPDQLFDETHIHTLLKNADPDASTYYKAILQNLFFATLNQEMNTPDKPDRRKFRHKAQQPGGRDQHYMIHNVYRYENDFQNPRQFLRPAIDRKEKERADVRHRYFTARTPATKEKYRLQDAQLREELAQLLQKDGFGRKTTQLLAQWNPYDQNTSAEFFDSEWMFGLSEGFDIAIGNPPYVRQEQIKDLKPALKAYRCFTGVVDLYVYFFEKSLDLLKENGLLTFISSNKYFRAGYGEKLRDHLALNTTILQLIDFGDAPVFTAIAYPSVVILRKTPPQKARIRALTWTPGPPVEEFETIFKAESFSLNQTELTADGWRLASPAVLRLVDKLRAAGKPLGEYVNGRFYYGIKTGFNEAFVVDCATRDRLIAEHPSSEEVLKPFLRGRDVKRWSVDYTDTFLIKIESSANKKHPWSDKPARDAEKNFAQTYPAIHAHFESFRNKLIARDDQGQYFWELRSCVYWQEFEQPKIIYPDIAQRTEFSFDTKNYYLANTLYLLPTNQQWLLGLLNSNTLFWFYFYFVD